MMDLGVAAIEPSTLEVLSTDDNEPSRGQRLTLRHEHNLNQKYLKFHLDNIYLSTPGSTEIRDSVLNQGI